MRKKCENTGDLFAWAERRLSAVVLDRYYFFETRQILVVRLSVAGRLPKNLNAEIIDLSDRRKPAGLNACEVAA